MHSIMMFFLTCGILFCSDQCNAQPSLSINQSNSYFAMAQVDEADFWQCPSCPWKYGRDVKKCRNPNCPTNARAR